MIYYVITFQSNTDIIRSEVSDCFLFPTSDIQSYVDEAFQCVLVFLKVILLIEDISASYYISAVSALIWVIVNLDLVGTNSCTTSAAWYFFTLLAGLGWQPAALSISRSQQYWIPLLARLTTLQQSLINNRTIPSHIRCNHLLLRKVFRFRNHK